jgi:chaperonin cofactor prefoldin
MSDQVPIAKLRDWLRSSLSSSLIQVERERDKLVAEITKTKKTLPDHCIQLSHKAEQDMETKRENKAQYRASKAVTRLTTILADMCTSLNIPADRDTVALRNLQREVSKIASDGSRSRQEWLRQIRPYYIIDMMTLGGNIDKVKRLGEELHTFLMGRGTLLRSLEDVNDKLSELTKLSDARASVTAQKESIEDKLAKAKQEEKALRARVDEIRQSPKIKEFMQTDSALRSLRSELLRTGFSRLGRPLRKLMSISERGDYPLPIEVRETGNEYIKKPFTTFLKETNGYPNLKAVMSALSNAVSSNKLALKQRDAKKVIERSQQIVSAGSLDKIHNQAKELKAAYDRFMGDPEIAGLVQQLRDTRHLGRANHKLQEELNAELRRITDNEKHLREQVDAFLRELENLASKISETPVSLKLS